MLFAFAGVVILGGTNLVLIVVTTEELDPFWSATLRFGGAGVLASLAVLALGLSFPRGRLLGVSVGYGFLAFFLGFASFYWASQQVPAGIASVIMGSVPLLTFLLATAQRIERFRMRGLLGACLAIVGIAVISARGSGGSLPILPLLAVVGAAASAAQSAIVIRRIPGAHPLVTNAVGMIAGSSMLLLTSVLAGESRSLPISQRVWVALAIMVGTSPLLFVLFVFVVQRWSATAASYQLVMFPLVSIVLAAILLDEPVSVSLLVGGPLVVLGVYVGALAPDRARSEAVAAPPAG